MLKFIAPTALIALMIFAASSVADDERTTGGTSQKPAGSFAGLYDLHIQFYDHYLDYLAKPETAKKLAAFQKNHYDSLIEAGFEKDQAITLIGKIGNPMVIPNGGVSK